MTRGSRFENGTLWAMLAVAILCAPYTARAAERIENTNNSTQSVRLVTDVVPMLTRLGCTGGGCHGKASGQNGFKLSLLGFEPELDYETLVTEDRGRRISTTAPDQSLLLLKATSRIPHGGGKRMDVDGEDYRMLRDWIAAGAPGPRADDPRLERIEISPGEQILPAASRLQLAVTAHFTGGGTRDVTRQAIYQSNAPEIAGVDTTGLVETTAQPGLVAVMARFGDRITTFHAAVPFTNDVDRLTQVNAQLDQLESEFDDSIVNRGLLRQWRRLALVPSPPCDDATYLRRAMLDVCGTLPTPDECAAFLADERSDKRARLIDALLERPEYASFFAMKWAAILQNRGAGYSTGQQRPGTTLFSSWIRDSIAENKPYDRFVSEILTASGSQNENPPAVWYRTVRKPTEYVESVAQAFLGVRIQCAQCHHHPAERWSQADYYGLAASFARVGRKGGFADAEVPTNEIIFVKDHGDARHPLTGAVVPPRALGGEDFALGPHDDPRIALARWITSADNPYFARTMVNRTWAHFLGRGLVHPIDDARSTNPPTNPDLLDALAADFAASGYDVKHLIRAITSSRAYQLDSAPTQWNAGDTQTYARFYPKRLSAEVLLDGLSQVLDVPTTFSTGAGVIPPGTRAIDLPDENVASQFLDIFGRPARMSACECERTDAPALTQALELVNSTEIQKKLTAENGYATRLAGDERTNADRAHDAFIRVLGRSPRAEELSAAVNFLDGETDKAEACRSLLWALLATNEFLFNH